MKLIYELIRKNPTFFLMRNRNYFQHGEAHRSILFGNTILKFFHPTATIDVRKKLGDLESR